MGNSVILHCEISKPDTPVEWRKGNNLLKSGEKYKIRQRGYMLELKIFNLTQEDSGVYSCTSETAQTSANITVSGKLVHFTSQSSKIRIFNFFLYLPSQASSSVTRPANFSLVPKQNIYIQVTVQSAGQKQFPPVRLPK